jgi:hypothetical protein
MSQEMKLEYGSLKEKNILHMSPHAFCNLALLYHNTQMNGNFTPLFVIYCIKGVTVRSVKIISHINKIKMMRKMKLTCKIQIKRNFSATKITSQYKTVLTNPLKAYS